VLPSISYKLSFWLKTQESANAWFNGQVNAIEVESHGKILVGGGFRSFNGVSCRGLVRLNPDSTIDTTFLANLGTGVNGSVSDIGITSTGVIYICGSFVDVNGTARTNVAAI